MCVPFWGFFLIEWNCIQFLQLLFCWGQGSKWLLSLGLKLAFVTECALWIWKKYGMLVQMLNKIYSWKNHTSVCVLKFNFHEVLCWVIIQCSIMLVVKGLNMQEFLFIWDGWSINWTIYHSPPPPPPWIETTCWITPVRFVLTANIRSNWWSYVVLCCYSMNQQIIHCIITHLWTKPSQSIILLIWHAHKKNCIVIH